MMYLKTLISTSLAISALTLAACSSMESPSAMNSAASSSALSAAIDLRSDKLKARDSSRHPRETIEFFGLQPGMKVAEILPGGGWYTQVLVPFLGSDGAIYGVSYADEMWGMFGMKEDSIAARIASSSKFAGKVAGYAGNSGIVAEGYAFGRLPEQLNGSLDAVIIIRGLHNLNRFEEKAGTMSSAMNEISALLKTGGIAAVVQHRAPESASDTWADGSKGYLKQSYVIDMFEKAGFELAGSSEINSNPLDMPTESDYVWRLPPSLSTAEDNKPAMQAIGESDRMTLKFVKK